MGFLACKFRWQRELYTWTLTIYLAWHQNWLRGLGGVGCKFWPLPLTSALACNTAYCAIRVIDGLDMLIKKSTQKRVFFTHAQVCNVRIDSNRMQYWLWVDCRWKSERRKNVPSGSQMCSCDRWDRCNRIGTRTNTFLTLWITWYASGMF